MSSFANLPSNVGLPSELIVNQIDPVVPAGCKSQSIKVYANNNPSPSASFVTAIATSGVTPDSSLTFPQTDLIFEIPTSQRNTWLDTRLSTISFRATYKITDAGTGASLSTNLRSSAYAFFDSIKVQSQSSGLLEYWPEYGLSADTMIHGTMSTADRFGMSQSIGVAYETANTGHLITNLTGTPSVSTTKASTASHSYSLPLLSGVIGVCADKFFPLGLTRKLMLTTTTAPVIPITIKQSSTAATTGASITVTLSDFCLNLETIDIGDQAMNQILSTAPDGKLFLHGQTWKTTSSQISSGTSGIVNLPVGLSGSSVRSLFCRFSEGGSASSTNATQGRYDSKGGVNQYAWSIGGVQVPSSMYNPLLYPSQSFRSYLMALGAFNSTQFRCGISPARYCKLLAGLTTDGNGVSQESHYTTGSTQTDQCSFILGENIESIPKRGMLSGKDLTFQKVNLLLSFPGAITNNTTAIIQGILDCVTVVDIQSGEVMTLL